MRVLGAIAMALGMALGIFSEARAAPANNEIPPLFSFKDGVIGVNFLGYHASAGLPGLLSGTPGLHAEAGTPFGQRAAAGLRGSLGNNGPSGELYAGATAGGNIKAAAGLGGAVNGDGASGGLYSGAQAGGAKSGSALDGGTGGPVRKTVYGRPKKVVALSADAPAESDENRSTVKKVTHVRGHPVKFNRFLDAAAEDAKDGQVVVERDYVPVVLTKQVEYAPAPVVPAYSSFGSSFLNAFLSPGGGPNGGGGLVLEKRIGPAHEEGEGVKGVRSAPAGSFFTDIFNIPISTLGAVSKFLSNNVGSGTTQIQKTYTISH